MTPDEQETKSPVDEAAPGSADGPRRAAEEDAGDPQEDDKGRTSLGRGLLAMAKEVVLVAVLALVISSLIRLLIGQVFIIPSGSMEDTLQVGDRVAVAKIGGFERGDIVVFKDPGGWMPPAPEVSTSRKVLQFVGVLPDTSQRHLIKRVVGMPGDTVTCCDDQGRLMVNGVPLDETAYLEIEDGVQDKPALVPFKVVVPADRIFVMGDNRNNSSDSRCHLADLSTTGEPRGMAAFIPVDEVVGPAKLVLLPFDRFSRLSRPSTFDSVPEPAQPPPANPVISPEGVGCVPTR
ncbi:signal peptidase I [Aestuariimicrobium ganziense]|uniref:signal peptidase I n=1 Tax=Aestuariimicrobium ganziense TaxID=2773677 RepID=UPI001F3EE050|nr:signal peptidase I [Aestuariimicrobium ganziense]